MWPECASPVNTKATKKTRTESRTAGKGQKKERPRVPHKAKVSEPQTVIRSPRNQLTTPGARCQAICDLGATSPPWGTEGGKSLILSGGRSFGGKACGHASGSTPQRQTKVKAAQRRRRRLGLDFPADFVAVPPGSTEPAARGWAARALIDCAQRAPSMSA